MFITNKNKYMFVHIPKTAGKSVYSVLQNNDNTFIQQGPTHSVLNKKMNGIFSFAFVRNPWDRMFSFYNFYCQNKETFMNSKNKRESVERFKTMDFNEWLMTEDIRVLVDKGSIMKMPQSDWICKGNDILVDYVGRFETLADDFNKIVKKLNLSQLSLPVTHKTSHDHYSKYYSKEGREHIEKYFAKDIELFGYKF